jgi:hypothetical protein
MEDNRGEDISEEQVIAKKKELDDEIGTKRF